MDTADEPTLHVFTDASVVAYGACAYLVKGEESNFVMAKNRVAPLKKLTIPQLELMAALVGGRLTSHIMSSLRNVKKCVLWSDSQIILHWISSRKQLKTFIANRVIEIKELTCEHSWKYCPTEHNPADLLSRGLSYEQLKNNKLWMHGPDWLTDEKQWPNEFQIDNKVMTTTCKDYENQETQDDIIRTKNNVLNVINVDRYHSFNKTVRILGYVQKFLDNCRNTVPNTRRLTTTYLTPNDIHNATMKLIEAVQHQRYSDVFESLCSNIFEPLSAAPENVEKPTNFSVTSCGRRNHVCLAETVSKTKQTTPITVSSSPACKKVKQRPPPTCIFVPVPKINGNFICNNSRVHVHAGV
ncbi:Hypothetical predicted protein [Mytilus galloprovincialis]|uniref:Uncharacterized protein n=1 Tax=Mytilus galloprovincialis TaxID=29158 RepID=A0A8B6H420_MYTGA|nr:Hypothetical predicted protein [Mytilus galloprovincialis]